MSEINTIKLEDASGQLIGEYDLVGTDTKVTQTETTTDAEYEILFSGTADNTTRTEGAGKSEGMTYNANHKALTIGTRFPNSTIGDYSVSTGSGNTASGEYSHAEGAGTRATGQYSHAEGGGNTASGVYSHAAGGGTTASGDYSHTEGGGTTASGMYSHVEGGGTVAKNAYQHVFGMYNTPDPSANASDQKGTYIEIVGNGTISGSTITTSNARTLDWSGNETLKGNLTVGGTSISVNGNTVAHSGNVATGDSNGKVKIAGVNVSVKGLGSNAYTSTEYAPKAGTTFTATTGVGVTTDTTERRVFATSVRGTVFLYAQGSATGNLGVFANNNSTTKALINLRNDNNVYVSDYLIYGKNTQHWTVIPAVGGDGCMEVGKYIDFHNANSQTNDYTFRFTNSENAKLTASGTITQGSSRKIKKNIKPLSEEEALKILELEPVSFDYKKDFGGDKDHRGFIAEDVDKILPNLTTEEQGDEKDLKHFTPMSLSYNEMIPYLVKVVQIQQEQINALKQELEVLHG